MTQEDKELLFKDLCSRLPYEVVVELDEKFGFNKGTRTLVKELLDLYCIEGIKPYLRPMSSMTEEEERDWWTYKQVGTKWEEEDSRSIDWLNAHHFDYCELIEKGIAIKVTTKNNPYI